MAVLRRGQRQHPADFDLCFMLAVAIEQLEEPSLEEVASTYRVAQALRPDQNEVLHRQGLALEALGRHADAEQLYRILADRDQDAHWFVHVGNAQSSQGKGDAATASCRRAVELDPDYAYAHTSLGNVFLNRDLLDEAAASYRRAVEIDPESIEAHTSLGHVLRRLGHLDEAMASCRRALELDPGFARAHNNIGALHREQGRMEEAIADFRLAIELDPTDFTAHSNLAHALLDQGHVDEAIAWRRRAIELDPEYADAHWLLGIAFALLALALMHIMSGAPKAFVYFQF